MGFRFRRSARLGPLRFNVAKGGLSSISVGGRGASFNIPVRRSGGARRAGSPYPATPTRAPRRAKDGDGKKVIPPMREIVFRVLAERPGHLEAQADTLPIRITAPTLEELQHEAREALIEHFGPAHCAYRVRVRRGPSSAVSSIRPVGRPAALCR